MKIAYIAPQPIPSRAANSIHVMKMMQALIENGHNATLFFQKSPEFTTDIFTRYGIKTPFPLSPKISLRGRLGTILYPLHNMIALICRPPDLVISRNLLTAWLTSRLTPTRVIFEIHDSPHALHPLALKIFEDFIKRPHSRVVVISKALAIHLEKEHAIPASKIICAPDAADPITYAGTPTINKAAGSFHAGYTGHLYQGRGIEIIGEMAHTLPDIIFHIVGGTEKDISYWQEKLSGLDNIQFHGHVPHALIPDYLQSFDILLAPYQEKVAVTGNKGNTGRWMSPLKIFEYMATGKPIICSDLPVLREVLNNDNAALCSPDNAAIWIETLQDLQKNHEKSEKIGQNALRDFLQNYTWSARVKNIISFIQSNEP